MRLVPEVRGILWSTLRGLAADIGDKNLGLISAGVAFFSMLSLFPALAAFVAIWGLFSDPVVVSEQLEVLRPLVPADVYSLIEVQLTGIAGAQNQTLGWAGVLSILLALWSARAGVGAMMMGLNAIFEEKNRGGLAHYATALGLTVALVCVGMVAMLAVVITPIILAFIPLGPIASITAEALRWLIGIFVIFVGIALLYRYGPNRRGPKLPWITPGAILSVICWIAVSIAFSVYISQFDSYNKTYGSIGAVIAMLMWLYLSSFLVLLGAGLNAHLELRTRIDTTVGEDRPMGQRGAYVADNLIETKP
ncbi:YihY/virulence factor BrkB family protein [Thalassococcus sp. S3]|uniref:YihY/virulence factor BrkB family protein n=1 Tax=Thalassococcus sp. S3 TaxID=2017482 RepID=UPI0010245F86|nr:YihY/virulence factor BrkB family protein [Thalassococcus sp. S3]QBF29961.1 ribonuclease BN [Thalassococcus sp. S3]